MSGKKTGPQRRYYLNYDVSFPRISLSRRDSCGEDSWEEGTSFAKAKAQLIVVLKQKRDRVDIQLKEARTLTKENVIEEANG